MLFLHKILQNGNTEKKYGFLVVVIFCIYDCFNSRYLPALGMAYAYSSLSVYSLCKRNGHYVIS